MEDLGSGASWRLRLEVRPRRLFPVLPAADPAARKIKMFEKWILDESAGGGGVA